MDFEAQSRFNPANSRVWSSNRAPADSSFSCFEYPCAVTPRSLINMHEDDNPHYHFRLNEILIVVTNALFSSLHGLLVGPVPPPTVPVSLRKKCVCHERHRMAMNGQCSSACDSPTAVSLRLRPFVSPPALQFSVRRKPRSDAIVD
jgi:hypothetical protein